MKKLKKLILTTVLLALSVSLFLGSLGGIVFANDAPVVDTLFGTTVNFKETVEYGGYAYLPVTAGTPTVTGPDGKSVDTVIDGTNHKFPADKLGYYTVKYSNDTSDYEFKILSESKDEWVLEVADNGADIPTVINTTGVVKLPSAKAVVYDLKDSTVIAKDNEDIGEEVSVAVFDSEYSSVSVVNGEFTASKEGTYFIRYSFKAGSAQSHYITKDFTVKAQKNFTDTERPSINVGSIAREHNLNTPVTLPKAVVTDNYDQNVKVVVKVTVGGVPVNQVEVDEDYDYAIKELVGTPVVFDNNKTMKFYPTKGGGESYKIEYYAVDDAGNESQTRNFSIEVYDKLAPEIKVEEAQIPREWGYTVINDKGNVADTTIVFPFPEVRDNSQVLGEDGKFDDSNLKVEFTIRDTNADKEVIKFSNILDQVNGGNTAIAKNIGGDKDGTTTGNTPLTFGKDGLNFLFSSAFTAATKSSTYSVTYKAINGSYDRSIPYSLKMSVTYEDKGENSAPTIKWNDVPAYFVIDDTDFSTFTVPAPIVTDNKSADRVRKDITLEVGAKEYVLEAGDELEFTDELELTNKDSGELETVDFSGITEITFKLLATDSAYNESELREYVVKVVNKHGVQDFDLSFNTVAGTWKVGDVVTAFTDLVISGPSGAPLANLDFTGFEIIVKNTADEGVSAVTTRSVVFYNEADGTIEISKCTFTPSKHGDYSVTVRAFDFSGNTLVKSFVIAGVKSSGGIAPKSSSTTKVPIHKSYTLNEYPFVYIETGEEVPHYRVISGPQYSLMGRELISKVAGAYLVNSLPFVAEDGSLADQNDISTAWHKEQNFTTSDQETPIINIINIKAAVMYEPDVDANVYLPDATVISKNGVTPQDVAAGQFRDYSIDVNGEGVDVQYDADLGSFYFVPGTSGTFTITYKAFGTNNNASYSYTMQAGDVTAPDFSVLGSHASSYKIDKSDFVFLALRLEGEDESGISKITFKKELIYPDGTIKKLEGKGASARDKEKETTTSDGYVLGQSGPYTVRYTVIDDAGNEAKQEFTFTVAKDSSGGGVPMAVISTVLVVLAVLLIIGVGVYVWFRPVKDGKKK